MQRSEMSSYQANLFDTRYKAPGSDEQTWLDVFKRVDDVVSNKLRKFGIDRSFVGVFALGIFIPGSPQLWNYGTNRRSKDAGSSCYTGQMGDSLESFRQADADAEKVYTSSGGFGLMLDSVRPRGSHIQHCSEGAMGSMCIGGPALKVEGTTGYITGSGRARGALMLQLGVRHPDFVEFVLKKRPSVIGWLDDWPTNACAVANDLREFVHIFSGLYLHRKEWPSYVEVQETIPGLGHALNTKIVNHIGDQIVPMVTDFGLSESNPNHWRPANRDWNLPLQNCNMSGRFSDSFMRAVEKDLPWTFAWFSPEQCSSGQEPVTKTDIEWDGPGGGRGLRETNFNLLVDDEDSSVSFCVDHPPKKSSVVITTWEGLIANMKPNQNAWRDTDYARFYRTIFLPAIQAYSGRIMAKQVWELFCENSWNHADPAAVFDDTYERFQPVDSKIYGARLSNPCAEFANSPGGSCNLGSINLRELADLFLRDYTIQWGEATSLSDWETIKNSPQFERFIKRICSAAIDATIYLTGSLEQTVAPVEYIENMSRHHYRTIGIGIMGLAEALMLFHIPYGSECSEYFSAAIMSEISLTAWETSFDLRQRHGFAKPLAWNPEKMRQIFEQRCSYAVDFKLSDDHLHRWACLVEKVANGYEATHTAVTSVAPTGTISMIAGWVTGKTVTSGIEPTFSRHVFRKDNSGQESFSHDLFDRPEHDGKPWMVTAMDGLTPMDHIRVQAAVCAFTCMAVSKCVTGDTLVSTANGLVRIGSLHEGETEDTFRENLDLEVASIGGRQLAKSFYYGGVRPIIEVTLGDGRKIRGTQPHRLRVATESGLVWRTLDDIQPGEFVALKLGANLWGPTPRIPERSSSDYGSQKPCKWPVEMTADLAFLIGALTADGGIARTTWTVSLHKNCQALHDKIEKIARENFDLKTRRTTDPRNGLMISIISSKTFVEWLDVVGFSKEQVPDLILRGPQANALAYLSGLYLDGWVTDRVGISQRHQSLLRDVQCIWDNLGIHTYFTDNYINGTNYPVLHAAGGFRRMAADLLEWIEPHKAARAADIGAGQEQRVFPMYKEKLKAVLLSRGLSFKSRTPFNPDNRYLRRSTFLAAAEGVLELSEEELSYTYVQVISVEPAGEERVYDLAVPTTEAFVANGIMNHNTINLPNSATVEDLSEVYFEAWRRDISATAPYRDGSKPMQVLTALDCPGGECKVDYSALAKEKQ